MRFIDSNMGTDLYEGLIWTNVLGKLQVMKLETDPAYAEIKVIDPNRKILALQPDGTFKEQEIPPYHQPGEIIKTPLLVRSDHPSFPGEIIAFLPS